MREGALFIPAAMNGLPQLSFPSYPFRLAQKQGKPFIWDDIRKKWLILTPEEWVRQHLIEYLIQEKKYPRALVSIETPLKYGTLQKRCDVLAYDQSGNPLLIVECKASSVALSNDTFQQAARYNINFKVPYLAVTNGLQTYCCKLDFENQSWELLDEIPLFDKR